MGEEVSTSVAAAKFLSLRKGVVVNDFVPFGIRKSGEVGATSALTEDRDGAEAAAAAREGENFPPLLRRRAFDAKYDSRSCGVAFIASL